MHGLDEASFGVPSSLRFGISLSSAPKHIITLTPADLDVENRALVDFVQFARHVIDQKDPLKAAKYAGMLYLALVSAFEARGMIEYEWAPTLTLEIESIEYEVSFRGDHG